MVVVEPIEVPFDGYGRPGNQAAAAAALREAGLDAALAGHDVAERGSLSLPSGDPARGPQTSLINEAALVAMTQQVGTRVAAAVAQGRFPLVLGADCSTLLGTVPALRASGPVGLLFLDGHEDTMPLDVSEDGEAANTEIGLLLGLTGRLLGGPLARAVGTLPPPELAVLGVRDEQWRQRFNVGSLRDSGVWQRDWREVAESPHHQARAAVAHLAERVRRWWLHVDLDVLDPEEFPAQGLPEVPDEPDGLTWDRLTQVATTAASCGGCVGWSVAIYDPEQDPDRSCARRILTLVTDVLATLPSARA